MVCVAATNDNLVLKGFRTLQSNMQLGVHAEYLGLKERIEHILHDNLHV